MSRTCLNRNRNNSRTNSYKGLLLVTCRRRVVWFGDYVGEDILVSLLVCSIKGMVPEGRAGSGKGGECVWFLGGRGTSYVCNFVSLDGFVRLCFI